MSRVNIYEDLNLCSEVSDLSANDYFIHTYGKTHMRSTAYIFGVLAGFLAFYVHKKQWVFSTCLHKQLSQACSEIELNSGN